MQYCRTVLAVATGLVLQSAAPAQKAPAPAVGSIDAYVEKVVRLRDEVDALAFDPKKLFGAKEFGRNNVTIAYKGDEFGWPVFSIAVRRGCLAEEKMGRHCGTRRIARMVRAPAPANLMRPRQRSWYLMQNVLRSNGPVRAALDSAKLEWVEASLDNCPGATAKFEEGGSIRWVAPNYFASDPGMGDPPVMHADNVEVTFEDFGRRSTYNGYVAEGSPAKWAVGLVEALDGCWQPASSIAPWRR
jgi:hypothetical protein